MFPLWTIGVAFAAAIVFVFATAWALLALYNRACQRAADRAADERVTDPGLSAAWAHSRTHPDANRAPFVLDTDSDDGQRMRPALRQHNGGDAE